MYNKKLWHGFAALIKIAVLSLVFAFLDISVVYAQEENYKLAAKNQNYELYYNPDSLAIYVKDKNTGDIYDSLGLEAQEGDLNKTWTGMKESGISVECRLENGNVRTWTITGDDATVKTEKLENGFLGIIDFSGAVRFSVQVTLTENGVQVSIPRESIVESEESGICLQSIYVYPFLGSSYGCENKGYLFVPDGCGALISTGKRTVATENYEKQIYGSDMGMGAFQSQESEIMLKSAEEISMPVFGSILEEGKQGIAGIVTKGDEYCKILAYASGIRTPYNLIMPKFIVRETYQMKLNQEGSSLMTNQKEPNPSDFEVSYVFLSGEKADYVGIAHTYRQWLLENNILTGLEEAGSDVPLKLEFILSEQKKGLLWSKTVKMTTVEQVDEILQELYDSGIKNMDVVLRGYSGAGASAAAPSAFSFTRKIGSKSQWEKEIKKFAPMGIHISLYTDFSRGYSGVKGYGNSQKAQAVNRVMLQTYENGIGSWLAPSFIADSLGRFAEKAAGMGMERLSVHSFGNVLYSNWNNKNVSTRADAVKMLQEADSAGLKLNLYAPYAYIWGKCNAIYNIPLNSSNYYLFTDTVPFMQIVLKGYIPYYSDAWNFHANAKQDLLKCIELGAYPSWYVSGEDSVELINTASEWIYSSQYSVWKDAIMGEYQEINKALKTVMGVCIKDRVLLDENVVRVDYDNGVRIYVNYGQADWTGDGVTVGGEGYVISSAQAGR